MAALDRWIATAATLAEASRASDADGADDDHIGELRDTVTQVAGWDDRAA